MFGLENYVLPEPFSLFNSLILSFGIYGFGLFIIKNFFYFEFNNSIFKKKFSCFSYIIGYNILISIFYFISIFTEQIILIFLLVSIILYFFSIKTLLDFIFSIKIFKKKITHLIIKDKLIYFLLFSYLLLSLGPITNADSLDYHIGVALKSIINEKFITEITWNTSTNAASGEMFIAFALFNGAEQLTSMTNFFAIIAIVFTIKNSENNSNKDLKWLILLFLSSPVIMSLTATSKPQLIFVASNFLAFVFIIRANKSNYKNTILPIYLISNSFVAKFSFIFSSSLIFLIILIKFFKNYRYIIFVSSLCLILIIFPHFYFKNLAYDLNFYEFLRFPVPVNIEGYEGFYHHLQGGGPVSFPFNIFHPLNLSLFNEGIGLFFIILIPFIHKILKKNFLIFFLIIISFSPLFFLKNTMSRYFLEMTLFLTILIFLSDKRFVINGISKILIIIQTIICSVIVFVYGLIFIFGSSTNDNKNLIRTYFANEYQIYKWSNSVLPKNSVLLSIPRSISFSKVETYSIDFTRFVNSNKEYYWNLIKEKKPNYILSFKELKENNCVEELAYHQKDIGYFTSRNIFQKQIRYDGYIYKFNYNYLPNCYINKL